MIKFFIKIRHQLLSKNIGSNYLLYAIGEIVLVVIGILIALQVNNWNINRNNNKQEVILLNDLKHEYLRKSDELNKKIYLRNILINSSTRILQMIQEGKFNVPRDTLEKLISNIFINPTFDASNSVTEELINSGKLYIIQNRNLRRYITEWNSQFGKLEEVEDNYVSYLSDIYYPGIIKKYPYSSLGRYLFDNNNNKEILSKIINNPIIGSYRMQRSKKYVDLEALLNDFEFESFMAITYNSSILGNLQSKDLKEFIENVINLIDNELQE